MDLRLEVSVRLSLSVQSSNHNKFCGVGMGSFSVAFMSNQDFELFKGNNFLKLAYSENPS